MELLNARHNIIPTPLTNFISGWYDRKAIGAFKKLVDINFLVALGPPGGGRNPLTSRIVRHFNLLSFGNLQDSSKERIFDTILGTYMEDMSGGKALSNKMVNATIKVRFLDLEAEL